MLWALIFRNLPSDPERWEDVVAKKRHEYEVYKSSHFVDERGNRHMDPAVNNPLSQDANSPWNKFFSDNELMKVIDRDVGRTPRDDPLFREERIKKMMRTMLFIYAKRVPQMGYKQGMHELLATAIKVQMDGCREYQRVTDNPKQLPPDFGLKLQHKVLRCINDLRYLEHDAYFLFDSIMRSMWEWYFVADTAATTGSSTSSSSSSSFLASLTRKGAKANVISAEATEQRLFSEDNNRHGGKRRCFADLLSPKIRGLFYV